MSTKRTTGNKKKPISVNASDPDSHSGKLKCVGGSQSDHWNNIIVNQAVKSLWLKHSDDETADSQRKATVSGLVGIGPTDEIEGMIAAQLLAAHNASMECYRRAMLGEQTFEGHRENLNQANKLSRSFAILLDALNRHRGKGQQKVTVEHVHVHAGGQAVVGVVEQAGGGDRSKSQDQAHARQITHAPQPAVWSEDKERQSVPVSGDAERPVPNARRAIDGRSEG
jgi:hypothetical protein